jgi:hypothetical protein
MKLQVTDITGELCMTYEDGEALLNKLRPALIGSEPVELDFAGTRVHMTPYFNGSIAALLQDYSRDELRAKLQIRNLPRHAVETLQRCLEVGEQYFHNPAYQEAVDRVLDAQAANA